MSDYGINAITKINPDGTASFFAFHGMLNLPAGLAFDSAGNLYHASPFPAVIDVSAPDGRESAYYAGMLSGPRFLAFTDDARVPLPLANQRAVPEPSTWALLALGLPALLGFRRRR